MLLLTMAALAALHVDRALVAGDLDAAVAAAEHAVDFERQLGLADEGWRALDARARVHDAAGRAEAADADRAEVLARAVRLRRGPAPNRGAFFGGGLAEAVGRWPDRAGSRPSPERELALRQGSLWRFGTPPPRSAEERELLHAEAQVAAVRAALHAVSFRGSERSLDEVRAELEPELRQARAARDDALAALEARSPGRAWLWGSLSAEPQPVAGPPPPDAAPVEVAVYCPELADPSAPTPMEPALLAAALLDIARGAPPAAARPTLAELAALDLGGAHVTHPACPSQEGLRDALLLAGAASVTAVEPPAKGPRGKGR